MRARLGLTGLIVLLSLVLNVQVRAASPSVGQAAPGLAVASLDGKPLNLADLRGKIIVLNFWATWCAPCREEMPALNQVFQQYHGKGVEMIGISIDKPRDRDAAVKIMKNYAYPAALAREATENGFDVPTAVPMTYVIDQHGKISKIFGGEDPIVTEKGLIAVLEPLLSR